MGRANFLNRMIVNTAQMQPCIQATANSKQMDFKEPESYLCRKLVQKLPHPIDGVEEDLARLLFLRIGQSLRISRIQRKELISEATLFSKEKANQNISVCVCSIKNTPATYLR
jgi:hypothetical protein